MTRQGLICPNRYSPSEASLTLKLKVGNKGYVIIPKAIREAAGAKEGDELIVSLNDGITLTPAKKFIQGKISESKVLFFLFRQPAHVIVHNSNLEREEPLCHIRENEGWSHPHQYVQRRGC